MHAHKACEMYLTAYVNDVMKSTCNAVTGCMHLLCRAPSSLWALWNPYIFHSGAYIMHRRAMQQLLDAYLPGLAPPVFDCVHKVSFANGAGSVALGLATLGCAGAAASGRMQQVNLTRLQSTNLTGLHPNWRQALSCVSELVLFSAVSSQPSCLMKQPLMQPRGSRPYALGACMRHPHCALHAGEDVCLHRLHHRGALWRKHPGHRPTQQA